MQIRPRHARLDDRVAKLLVDLKNSVHPAQVQHDRTLHARRTSAVPEVSSRDVVHSGTPRSSAILRTAWTSSNGARLNYRRRVVLRPIPRPERIAELEHVVPGEHMLGPDDTAKCLQRSIKLAHPTNQNGP